MEEIAEMGAFFLTRRCDGLPKLYPLSSAFLGVAPEKVKKSLGRKGLILWSVLCLYGFVEDPDGVMIFLKVFIYLNSSRVPLNDPSERIAGKA